MKNILTEFYYGNLHPEEVIRPKDPEYRNINQKISDAMEYFKKNLSENDLELLEEMIDLSGQSKAIQATDTFVQGFRMGVLMMVEVFYEEQKINEHTLASNENNRK